MDNQMYSNLPLQMGTAAITTSVAPRTSSTSCPAFRATTPPTTPPPILASSTAAALRRRLGNLHRRHQSSRGRQVGDPRFTWTAIGVDSVDQFQVQTAGISSQYAGQGVQNYSIKSGRMHITALCMSISATPSSIRGPLPARVQPRPLRNRQGRRRHRHPGWHQAEKRSRTNSASCSAVPISRTSSSCSVTTVSTAIRTDENLRHGRCQHAAMIGYTQSGTPLGYADSAGYDWRTASRAQPVPTAPAQASQAGCITSMIPATQTPNCAAPARASPVSGMKNRAHARHHSGKPFLRGRQLTYNKSIAIRIADEPDRVHQ